MSGFVPVKRGELVAVRSTLTWASVHGPGGSSEDWTAGVAVSVTRAGLVRVWRDAHGLKRKVERVGVGDVFATGLPGSVLQEVAPRLPVATREDLVALLTPYRA